MAEAPHRSVSLRTESLCVGECEESNILQWTIPENIHNPPTDDTELGTLKFQDFQE